MLKRGDRIRHIATGETAVVVERLGNDVAYAVRIRLESGNPFQSTNKPERIMTEAAYWLEHGWELMP